MQLQPENIPDSAVNGVLALAHHAGGRDWVPATSGNFSVRLSEHECAVTASGGDKGVLERSGIIRARLTGEAHPRASAEAPLHYALYRLSSEIGAVAHVHATSGVLASMLLASDGRVRIHGLEMLKAFRGYKSHEATMDVPVFDNDQDMDGLATLVENALAAGALPWGFLLAGHGLYAWGRDEKETLRHLDAFDYLFTLMLRLKGIPA